MGKDRAALTVLGAGAVLLLVLFASTAGGLASVRIGSSSTQQGASTPSHQSGGGSSPGGGNSSGSGQTTHPHTLSWIPTWGQLVIIVVLSAIALVLIANLRVALVRRRKVRSTRATTVSALQTEDIEPPPNGLESMLGGQLSTLDIGTPRNAIVAAWVQLEDFATSHGLAKDPADTPAEFVARALATYDLDLGSIQRLADLYREARFSRHEIDERHRDEARACIERLTGRVATP